MPSERRHTSRCAVEPPGCVQLASDDEGIILNVSDDGIGIAWSSAHKHDCDVDLAITLSRDIGSLCTKGKIAWTTGSGEAGIHLERHEWLEYIQQWRSRIEASSFVLDPSPATSQLLPAAAEQSAAGYPDDQRVVSELRACWLRNLEADVEADRVRSRRINYFAGIVLAAIICAGAFWVLLSGKSSGVDDRTIGSSTTSEPAEPKPAVPLSESTPMFPQALASGRQPPLTADPPSAAASLQTVGAPPSTVLLEVLPGISYETGPSFARFFFDLKEDLRVHTVALQNPDRIYFDVPQFQATLKQKSISLNNAYVQRVRVGQRDGGVTRIVLDLRCSCTYQVQQASSGSGHQVEIEIRPGTTARLDTTPLS
jgi:hypothetical protein